MSDFQDLLPKLTASQQKQVAQSLYYAITGKTEKIVKSFSDSYDITLESLIQLNDKICDLIGPMGITCNNCAVTLFRLDNKKEVFSSFDRFKVADKSSDFATESVELEYNLLKTEYTEKAQPYKVIVRLLNRLAVFQRIKRDGFPSSLINRFRDFTIIVEIEYIDYTIAFSIMGGIISWIDEIKEAGPNPLLRFIQDHSDSISKYLPTLGAGIVMYSIIKYYGSLKLTTVPLELLFKNGFVGIGITFIFYRLSEWACGFLESTIDSYDKVSTINLCNGDNKLISKQKRSNISLYLRTSIQAVFTIFLGVISSSIYDWIKSVLK